MDKVAGCITKMTVFTSYPYYQGDCIEKEDVLPKWLHYQGDYKARLFPSLSLRVRVPWLRPRSTSVCVGLDLRHLCIPGMFWYICGGRHITHNCPGSVTFLPLPVGRAASSLSVPTTRDDGPN